MPSRLVCSALLTFGQGYEGLFLPPCYNYLFSEQVRAWVLLISYLTVRLIWRSCTGSSSAGAMATPPSQADPPYWCSCSSSPSSWPPCGAFLAGRRGAGGKLRDGVTLLSLGNSVRDVLSPASLCSRPAAVTTGTFVSTVVAGVDAIVAEAVLREKKERKRISGRREERKKSNSYGGYSQLVQLRLVRKKIEF